MMLDLHIANDSAGIAAGLVPGERVAIAVTGVPATLTALGAVIDPPTRRPAA